MNLKCKILYAAAVAVMLTFFLLCVTILGMFVFASPMKVENIQRMFMLVISAAGAFFVLTVLEQAAEACGCAQQPSPGPISRGRTVI